MAISIRPAIVQDVPFILSLIRELAAYEKLSDQVVANEALLREHLFGERPVVEVLIGEWDGTPVGYALTFLTFSTFLGRPGIYLEDLYVQPAYRNRGIGKAMLVRLARHALERGYGRVEWSVLKWNTPSIKFYEKLGAVNSNEWTMYRLAGTAIPALAGLRKK